MQMNMIGKIGIAIGIIGGLIGMIVGILAAPVMGTIMALIFIAVFGGVFWVTLKPMMDANQLKKTGKPANATVVELWDTGVTLNNDPQIGLTLNVQPQDGTPSFQVKTRTFISRLQSNMYQPGQTLSVMYDPNDHTKVAITSIGASNSMSQADADTMLKAMDKENRDIISNGLAAKAIVLNYSEMGINVNGMNPAVTLDLEVMPDNGKPFKATTKGIVKDTSVPKFQPGKEIYVRYDPKDNTRVAVEHS